MFQDYDDEYQFAETVDDCDQFAPWTQSENNDPHYQYPYVSETSLTLPVTSDVLYFLGSGSMTHGSFEVTADGDGAQDAAVVEVKFYYYHPQVLDHAKVCSLHRKEGDNGVGIFVSVRIVLIRSPHLS